MVGRSDHTHPRNRDASQGPRQPLRLVRGDDLPTSPRLDQRGTAAGAPGREPRTSSGSSGASSFRAVAQANLEAAIDHTLDPRDPRWLVAIETSSQLSGSLLTFERRRKVLAFAQKMGVRPFDANLIIAAVQDRARRGEAPEHAKSTIALTAPARLRRRWWPYVAAAGFAIVGHSAALWFFLR